ncbi:MAG: FG-GAP repeat domain-containing protein [Terriglobia bacterium]
MRKSLSGGLVVLLLGMVGVAGVPPDESSSSIHYKVPWLKELRASLGRVTEAKKILRRVPADQDNWITEAYDEQIGARLKEFSRVLAKVPLDRQKLAGFVHPEFRGTSLTPRRRHVLRAQAPVVEQWEPATQHAVTAPGFPREIKRFLAGLKGLERAQFKVIGIWVDPQDSKRIHTRLWYDLVGRSPTGAVQQRNGHWQVEWLRPEGSDWQFAKLTAELARLVHADRPQFVDVTRSALGDGPAFEQLQKGLEYWTLNLDVSFMTNQVGHHGVAVADVEGDGDEDFYVAQPSGLPNRFFESNGDGTFTERARDAGLDLLDDTSAPLFLDFDNDGDPDLLLLGPWGPLLFRNDGGWNFTRLDATAIGLMRPGQVFHNLMSACAADYDRDGWLDFYATSYVLQHSIEGLASRPMPYHDAQNGPPNILYRNNGDGTFSQTTEASGMNQNNNRFSFACAWADYDKNGYPDLYVANDFGRNNLYRSNGDGTFGDVAAEAGVEDIAAGMSAAWVDYDNDGWLDLYVGNMWSSAGLRLTMQKEFQSGAHPSQRSLFRRHAKGNTLFRNRGDGTFEDVSDTAGVTLGRWAWSSDFFDLDRDGFQDLFILNGFITNESKQDL